MHFIFHTSEYPAANRVRTYDIEAISLPIVYNKFGDHDPDGLIFVPLSQAEDKPRNIGFLIHGHKWRSQPDNPLSNVEAAKGAISVGNVYNLELLGGASGVPGDYLYRSGSLRWDVESGMWGILRIKPRTLFYTCALRCLASAMPVFQQEQKRSGMHIL